MINRIYRPITQYLTLSSHICVYLECGHAFADKVKNKWNVGDKVNCIDCVSQFEILKFFVTEESEND